jgi:hypothetical protein
MADQNTIDKFNKISGYDITNFFFSTQRFFQIAFPQIEKFYKGDLKFIDKKYFVGLDKLEKEAIKVTSIFKEKKELMLTVDFWDLLDMAEVLKTSLQRTQKLSKYLRSSIVKGKTSKGFVFQYIMSAEETLEDVAKNVMKSTDFQNYAQQIALDNDLREVDWDIDGGTELDLRNDAFQNNLVTSMIDNTIGERIYGKDLKKLLTIDTTEEDLVVLDYKETVYQTVEILSQLSKGDIPEFPSLGLDGNIYKGVNYSQLNYPSIVREMNKSFSSDDLFQDFKVRSISHDNGDLFIDFEVNTKFNLLIIKTAVL